MQAAMQALTALGGETLIAGGAGLQMAGAAVSTVAAVSAMNYQRQVALINEQRAKENALRAQEEADQRAKQQDEMALMELGAVAAKQGASGIRMGSGTPFLERLSFDKLAGRDRYRIAKEGEGEAEAYLTEAGDYAADAKNLRQSGMFSFLEGGLNIGRSAISGASSIIDYRRRTLGIA